MVMPHPLLPVGLPPAGVAIAMNQMSQLSGLANMAAMSQVQEEESKVRGWSGLLNGCYGYRHGLHTQTSRILELVSFYPGWNFLANAEDLCLAVPAGYSLPEPLPQRRRPPPSRSKQPITFQSLFLAVIIPASSSTHARTGSASQSPSGFLFHASLSLASSLRGGASST